MLKCSKFLSKSVKITILPYKMYCLSNFCCVCLSINTDLLNLNKLDDDYIPILNKLIFIAFGHERLDLDVIKSICSTCLKDLRIAYKFKTSCLTSNDLLIGYNSQLKYFTGSVGVNTELEVTLSENERALTDENNQKTAKSVLEKKYKPRPLCKQKEYLSKIEVPQLKKPGGGVFNCKHCNKSFQTRMKRLIHFNKTHHKNLRKFQIVPKTETSNRVSCSMCEKSYMNARLLKCHIRSVHFIDSNKFCRHCNRSFSSRKCFISHMKRWHNYNNFTCQICNKKYLKELNYNKHMALHAENKIVKRKKDNKKQNGKKLKMVTRYVVCNTCDKIFINVTELRRHMLTHGKSSFSIDNTFDNGPDESVNSEILRQILSEPPIAAFENPVDDIEILPEIKLEPIVEIKEEIIDEVPPGVFNINTETPNMNLNDPISSVVSESPVEKPESNESSASSEIEVTLYECNICNKQFTVKSFLNAHLLIHNNAVGPNFECIQCTEKFTDKKDFAQHILANTCGSLHPTKSFSCGICFRLFKYEFSLKQHLRTH